MLILQAYAQKIGQCLAKIAQLGATPAVQSELCKWTCQCGSLLIFLAVGNLEKFLAFTTSKLDGTITASGWDYQRNQLPNAWYQDFLVRALNIFVALLCSA